VVVGVLLFSKCASAESKSDRKKDTFKGTAACNKSVHKVPHNSFWVINDNVRREEILKTGL